MNKLPSTSALPTSIERNTLNHQQKPVATTADLDHYFPPIDGEFYTIVTGQTTNSNTASSSYSTSLLGKRISEDPLEMEKKTLRLSIAEQMEILKNAIAEHFKINEGIGWTHLNELKILPDQTPTKLKRLWEKMRTLDPELDQQELGRERITQECTNKTKKPKPLPKNKEYSIPPRWSDEEYLLLANLEKKHIQISPAVCESFKKQGLFPGRSANSIRMCHLTAPYRYLAIKAALENQTQQHRQKHMDPWTGEELPQLFGDDAKKLEK